MNFSDLTLPILHTDIKAEAPSRNARNLFPHLRARKSFLAGFLIAITLFFVASVLHGESFATALKENISATSSSTKSFFYKAYLGFENLKLFITNVLPGYLGLIRFSRSLRREYENSYHFKIGDEREHTRKTANRHRLSRFESFRQTRRQRSSLPSYSLLKMGASRNLPSSNAFRPHYMTKKPQNLLKPEKQFGYPFNEPTGSGYEFGPPLPGIPMDDETPNSPPFEDLHGSEEKDANTNPFGKFDSLPFDNPGGGKEPPRQPSSADPFAPPNRSPFDDSSGVEAPPPFPPHHIPTTDEIPQHPPLQGFTEGRGTAESGEPVGRPHEPSVGGSAGDPGFPPESPFGTPPTNEIPQEPSIHGHPGYSGSDVPMDPFEHPHGTGYGDFAGTGGYHSYPQFEAPMSGGVPYQPLFDGYTDNPRNGPSMPQFEYPYGPPYANSVGTRGYPHYPSGGMPFGAEAHRPPPFPGYSGNGFYGGPPPVYATRKAD